MPWVPKDLATSLSEITTFLRETFGSEIYGIGLYGSWRRGDAGRESDVDLVVFLNHEVPWFDAMNGMISRSNAHKDLCRWHAIEQKANKYHPDSRVYSIAVVTQAMLDYYYSRGPIHLQNWAQAFMNCHILWGNLAEVRIGLYPPADQPLA